MAKKSNSKKVSIGLDKLVYGCAALLALVAFCMLFVPALSVDTGLLVATFKGTEVVFGLEGYFVFSFMNFLTYLFVVAALVFAVLRLFGVVKSKLFDLLAAGLLIAAGILFFMASVFAAPVTTGLLPYASVYNSAKVGLLAGPIVAGILSLLAGAGVLCYSLLGIK